LPTSTIHLREKLSGSKKTIREVVDGQQRLRTILDFLRDKITISPLDNKNFGGKRFSELPDEVKNHFLNYELAVNVLEDASDAEVLDIFARLNTYTVKLNRQELRNARYHGEFKSTVYRLASESISFFTKYRILSPRQIIRMAETELISELLVAMDLGLQDKKKTLDLYYRNNDREYPKGELFSERYKATIESIKQVFGETINKTRLRRRTLFYSLFCVLYDLTYGLPEQTGPNGSIPKENFNKAREALLFLDAQIKSETPAENYVDFVFACGRQTDNIKPRQIRHDAIKSVLLPLVKR